MKARDMDCQTIKAVKPFVLEARVSHTHALSLIFLTDLSGRIQMGEWGKGGVSPLDIRMSSR